MMRTLPDELAVYSALRGVLNGKNAGVRNFKKVRKIIVDAIPEVVEVSNLIEIFGVEATSQVAQVLLRRRVFKSMAKAKNRFPETFNDSPAQDVDLKASRDQGDVNKATTTARVVRDGSENLADFAFQIDDSGLGSYDTCHDSIPPIGKCGCSTIRSRSSISFPIMIQDRILTQVQRLLEKACWEFGLHAIPGVIDKRRWESGEGVELNRWVSELQHHQEELFGGHYDELLRCMANLRHTAVHRVPITAQRVESFLHNAEKFTELLGDGTRREMLAKLRLKTRELVEEVESHQGVLGSKHPEVDGARGMAIAKLDMEKRIRQSPAIRPLIATVEEIEISLKIDGFRETEGNRKASCLDLSQDSESQVIEYRMACVVCLSEVALSTKSPDHP